MQQGNAYGFVGNNMVFNVTVPTNNTEGFVAYGTTSYGYADFDNLHIEDDPTRMKTYFDSIYFSFSSKLRWVIICIL